MCLSGANAFNASFGVQVPVAHGGREGHADKVLRAAGTPESRAEAGSVQQEAGAGISGIVDGKKVALGTWAWLGRHVHQDEPVSEPTPAATAQDASAVDLAATQQMQVGWFPF